MVTISLDEYGEFEKNENKPLFIAGLIFDDLDKDDEVLAERARIKSYYKKAISDVENTLVESGEYTGSELMYPRDLHSNGNRDRDRNVIKPVKLKISETLSEFIEYGTYNQNPLKGEDDKELPKRKGMYHLFVIIKSADGKKKLLSENAGMLANDEWAANRYFHMASTVVNRLIFHNPLYPNGHASSINIDIATRATGSTRFMDPELRQQFEEQAYSDNIYNQNSDYGYYKIMTPDIYRTLIAQEMVSSDKINVKIDKLNVSSIKYNANRENMEFLYLSDSICSVLGYRLYRYNTCADDWLEDIVDRVKQLNPQNENMVFGYDEIDNYFSKAWNCYENKHYYEALSVTYDAMTKEGKFAEYYKKTWFPYIEDAIKDNISPEDFTIGVNNLEELLMVNNLNQEKSLYLMEQFESMADKVSLKYKSKEMMATALFKLYNTGVSVFSYIGAPATALEYYKKCKKYAYYVGTDAMFATNNKLAGCLTDAFEWDKALNICKENIDNYKAVSDIKRKIWNEENDADFLDEAKMISQLAGLYALKRSNEAEKYFRKALSIFEKGTANYKITQSYLLHYYADMNMQPEFDREITDYFDGKNTYWQMFGYITDMEESAHSLFSVEYAIYVLIRGIFYFHQDEIDDVFWGRLCNIDKIIYMKTGSRPSGHPWEITYKYLEIMAVKRNDDKAVHRFALLKSDCLTRKGTLISAIEQIGKAEAAQYEKNFILRDSVTEKLAEFLCDKFDILKNRKFSDNGNVRYGELTEYFTFMYR